jgi:PAS domain S-box-containing protein
MAKARIMVVEDEGVVAMALRESLQGLGYDVPVVAMSGEDALARLLETEPDLVLMDIQLKGGATGIQTAHLIRQRLDVPVIYLTAYSDSETLEQAQLTEPYGYVLKPYDERSLHAIIQMSLMKHRRTRTARESGWWMTAVAESMMEAVVICDPKGYVKFANPSAEGLLGKVQHDLIEKRLSEVVRLIDGGSRAPIPFPVSEPLLEGKSTVRVNCRLVAGESREIPIELSASPLRSPEGTLFGILYVVRETSEREQIQTLLLRELEELSLAQKKFLPARDISVPGLKAEWLFLPTAFGGGDTVGFFPLDATHAAFYALDVIGQGIFPSLFSLLLHTFLDPSMERGGMLLDKTCEEPFHRVLSPSEVVKGLNQRFYLRDEANPYFTLAYGVIDTATGLAQVARAGHPFPVLQTAKGVVSMVKPEGYAVGLFPGSEVASEELRLARGDRLFLYSDGFVDCTNAAGTRYSSARLVEKITAGRAMALPELVAALRADLVAWRGSETFADDVSLLVLERQ